MTSNMTPILILHLIPYSVSDVGAIARVTLAAIRIWRSVG